MMYGELEKNLMEIDPEGHLYDGFQIIAVNYLDAVARLGHAEASHAPQTIQFKEDTDGRFGELSALVEQINLGLQSHQPPLPTLPIERRELTELAMQYLGDTFTNRTR